MISIRLDYEMEKEIETCARKEGVSKSKIIKIALDQYLRTLKDMTSPYELGKDLFGRFSSNEGDLSTTYKKRLGRIIDKKYTH